MITPITSESQSRADDVTVFRREIARHEAGQGAQSIDAPLAATWREPSMLAGSVAA